MFVESNVKEQVASYIDRSKLPDEIEPLKDIVVTLSQALLKLWEELDVLRAENAALRAEKAKLRGENAILRAENADLKARNEILTEEINLLKQKVFGSNKRHSQKKILMELKEVPIKIVLNLQDAELQVMLYQGNMLLMTLQHHRKFANIAVVS